MFYVIGVYGQPWVLTGPHSLRQCTSAIRWQGGQFSDWVIAKRVGPTEFEDYNGNKLTVGRGPYTVEHFAQFQLEWKQEQTA